MQILTTAAKNKLVGYKDEFLIRYPNVEKDEYGASKYTDSEWLDEVVKRFLINQLRVGERTLRQLALVETDFNFD